jgi:very-short-patch-repair endonuclease
VVNEVPRSWRTSFDVSLQRLISEHHLGPAPRPSIDEYLDEFPLEPDDRWGQEMDELHRAALRAYVLRQVAFISNDLERAVAMCGSPPERAMLYALAILAWEWVDGVLLRVEGSATGLIATRFTYVEIEPQGQIDADRVDFLMTMGIRTAADAPPKTAKLVVECDGHEWHERTREQARNDRARDRRLQARDLAVYRYTGSEVWADVFGAAREALEELARRFGEA